jgi:hypothetical protein
MNERMTMLALHPAGRDTHAAAPIRVWEEPQTQPSTDSTCSLPIPQSPQDLAAHYDLTISHPSPQQSPFGAFDRWLAQAAAARGLSCALLHDGVVHEAIRRLDEGRLTIGFHLDYFALWHVANDPYARLSEAIQDAGGRPINAPARARIFTDKAVAHNELLRRGLGVPETVILRPCSSGRRLTTTERRKLHLDEPGACVYLKPANGFGSHGVVRLERTDPESVQAALQTARQAHPHDTLLIQREVTCPLLRAEDGQERPAYWRVLYCLDELIACWWTRQGPESGRPSYSRMSTAEIRRLQLQPILAYAQDLAGLSGLNWFSTELCLSNGSEPSSFHVRGADGKERPVVAIDYLNDQCDVDVQSRWLGAPPDAVVRHAAGRFAEAAWRRRQILPMPAARTAPNLRVGA